jgi:hypothetical protein
LTVPAISSIFSKIVIILKLLSSIFFLKAANSFSFKSTFTRLSSLTWCFGMSLHISLSS